MRMMLGQQGGEGRRGKQWRGRGETRWRPNHPVVLIVLVVIVEAELHNRGSDALQVDERLFAGSPTVPRSVW